MKEKIASLLQEAIGDGAATAGIVPDLSVPDEPKFGHYSTNVAMRLAKARGVAPLEFARELAAKIERVAPAGFFERVEAVAPGFINFWLSTAAIQEEFAKISSDEHFGNNKSLDGKMVMVEFTDANPFKLFHIGHLMSNTIGESFARLYEAAGANVRRANYYGDIGLHIAMSVWSMNRLIDEMPADSDDAAKKMDFLGKAYAFGAKAYKDDPEAAKAIVEINKKLYDRSDPAINALYDKGLTWSLDYFKTIYQRLGSRFEDEFPESRVAQKGVELVRSRPDIFIESEGAIIFPGEKYGLHTRVFINSQGLPVYEAKELGLNKNKFELYPLDLSIVVTGKEIEDYFKVLLKAMELTIPDVAAKTRHAPHGMLRLPTGKMSSRTGDVITAVALIDQAKEGLAPHMNEKTDLTPEERAEVMEAVAIGALKYSILRQSPGQDIIFDFDKSLSFEGDAGPYVQYAYARLESILRKAGGAAVEQNDFSKLDSETELALVRKILEFPDVVLHAQEKLLPSALVNYIYKLAVAANKFYETTPILKDEDAVRRSARLALAAVAARTIKSGLNLLGIQALEKV
jgi:arginyl-tRNA synthetase